MIIEPGNINDFNFIELHSNTTPKQFEGVDYVLADKGYDSIKNKNLIKENGAIPLILQNKRRIKDPKKIIKFNKKEMKIYKKRSIVENTFAKIKKYRKVLLRFEKYISTYIETVNIGLLLAFSKRIVIQKSEEVS